MLFDPNGITKDWEPLSNIDRNLVSAVIAAEDGKFCTHDGFDREATTLNDKIDASRRPYAMTIPDFRNWDGRIPEPYLLKYGTPEQKKKWLGPLPAGPGQRPPGELWPPAGTGPPLGAWPWSG